MVVVHPSAVVAAAVAAVVVVAGTAHTPELLLDCTDSVHTPDTVLAAGSHDSATLPPHSAHSDYSSCSSDPSHCYPKPMPSLFVVVQRLEWASGRTPASGTYYTSWLVVEEPVDSVVAVVAAVVAVQVVVQPSSASLVVLVVVRDTVRILVDDLLAVPDGSLVPHSTALDFGSPVKLAEVVVLDGIDRSGSLLDVDSAGVVVGQASVAVEVLLVDCIADVRQTHHLDRESRNYCSDHRHIPVVRPYVVGTACSFEPDNSVHYHRLSDYGYVAADDAHNLQHFLLHTAHNLLLLLPVGLAVDERTADRLVVVERYSRLVHCVAAALGSIVGAAGGVAGDDGVVLVVVVDRGFD